MKQIMIPYQTYIIESILATGVLYIIYLLALRNRPMLVFNRFMLLGMVLLGTLLPLINFSLPQNSEIPTSSFFIEEVFVNVENQVVEKSPAFQYQYVYYIIAFVLLIYFIVQAIHIIRLRNSSELLHDGLKSYNLIEGKYPHFSFFNQIFINKKLIGSDDELKTIIEHEKVHVQQWHSLDILFFEVLKIVFWFNPFIWLLKKLAVENHEYLADKGMLQETSKNLADYFNDLLQTSLFTYKITLANNFNHSLLKKRVVMMTKKLKTVERLIPLFILPILVFVGIFFACSEGNLILGEQAEEVNPKKSETNAAGEELFFIVEEMPKFNGEDHNKFRTYVQDSLVYPEEAIEKGIVGRVFVQFVVGATGEVRDAIVVRGVDPLLDAEALRVVNSSPDWTPGVQRGRKVAVQFTFPVTFMNEDTKEVEKSTNHQAINVMEPTPGSDNNQRFAEFSAFKSDKETPEIVGRFVIEGIEKEADISYLKGEVEFLFDLNEDAQVLNFSIIKSPNSKLSEKARLLLESNHDPLKSIGAKGTNLRGVMSF